MPGSVETQLPYLKLGAAAPRGDAEQRPADPPVEAAAVADFAPAFLFGMERSGTTLLSMMVGAHPQIAVPLSTTGMWQDFFVRLRDDYDDLKDERAVATLVNDVLAHERIQLWGSDLQRDRILADCRPGDFGAVVAAFHAEYARQHRKPRWANIDIATLDAMHVVNSWLPDSRFLHIFRDGRDVALSHQTMPFGSGNIAECAVAWRDRVGQNLRMGALLGPDRYLAIRYEDLILRPEAILQRVCDFLGVPFSPAMLDYASRVEHTIPEDKLWLWPAIKKPPQRDKVRGWKSRMSNAQRIVYEWSAGDLLSELGYETYESPPRRASAYLLEFGYFLDRGQRWKRFKKKVGFAARSQLERQASKRKSENAERQRAAFNQLVEDGTYSTDFDHSAAMKEFVATTIRQRVLPVGDRRPVRLLDCGCGTGAWLSFQQSLLNEAGYDVRPMGFDVSERMVGVAQEVLSESAASGDLRQSDLFAPDAFTFDGCEDGFDLVFAYDVIQQLPPARQEEACRLIASRLADNGVAVIFDQDGNSPYGRSMRVKKLLRRYLGIPLVPAFYCNAHYPPLSRIRDGFNRAPDTRAEVVAAPEGPKRALIIRQAVGISWP